MGTLTAEVFETWQTTVIAGTPQIYYPSNDYFDITFYVEPVSGGTADVEVTGDTTETVRTGSPVWHEGSADLTGATANVTDVIDGAANAIRLTATTENAVFKLVTRRRR